jgi:hypothetical protein
MKTNQIELTFSRDNTVCRSPSRVRRVKRARWWFARMHEVVELGRDWNIPAAPPVEQINLRFNHGTKSNL